MLVIIPHNRIRKRNPLHGLSWRRRRRFVDSIIVVVAVPNQIIVVDLLYVFSLCRARPNLRCSFFPFRLFCLCFFLFLLRCVYCERVITQELLLYVLFTRYKLMHFKDFAPGIQYCQAISYSMLCYCFDTTQLIANGKHNISINRG